MKKTQQTIENSIALFYRSNTSRIVTLFLLVALVAAFSAYSFLYYTHDQTNKHAINTIRSMAESVRQNFNNLVGEIDFCLRLSSDEYRELKEDDKLPSLTSYLEKQQATLPVDYIRASNAQGDVIYGTDTERKTTNIADRDYFIYLRDHADAGLYINKPIESRINKKKVWIFARRMNGADGSFLGVVFSGIFVERITLLFDEIKTENGEIISLLGRDDVVIARTSTPNNIQASDDQHDRSLMVNRKEPEGFFVGYEGKSHEKYIHWYATSEPYGFTVTAEVSHALIFMDWQRYSALLILILVSFFVVLFVLARSLIRSWREQKVAAEETRLSALVFGNAYDAIAITDADNRFVRVNQTFCDLTGYTQDELLGRKPSILKSSRNDPQLYQEMWQALVTTGGWVGQLWNRRKDGSLFFERLSISVIYDDHRAVSHYVAIAVDLTHSRKTEQRLRELSQAVEQSPSSVVICDLQGNITYVNEKFCEVTGYNSDEVLGKNPRFLKSGYTPSTVYEELWQAIASGREWRGEINSMKKNGDCFWEYTSFSSIRDDTGKISHYMAVKEDITVRKEYESRLVKQANFDNLTGLPNRMLAMDRLSQALARSHREGGRVGVMFIDLDHFKKVNDALGHAIGDLLLKQAAQRLLSSVRETDTVARLGGDEFMVILSDLVEAIDAELVAEKILSVCETIFSIDGNELQLSASIGITISPNDGTDPHLLVRNADIAMYQSKEEGRGAFHFFTAEMDARAHENLMIETEMRYAIDRNEFSVHYQPLVEIATQRIIGAEALIRWNNKRFGNISPGKFIPIVENTGLIVPVGEWMLCKACCDAAQWQKATGSFLQVAVNVASRQLEQGGFLRTVKDALEATGLPAHCLKLEITEGVLLKESPGVKKTIEDICALGVHLALDDFGTGYSSISYLRRFPFDTIKIDRSFVQEVPHTPQAVNLVRSIVAMAHSMHMAVVGEGVETTEQLEFLSSIGCEISQGWLTGKPMPFPAFLELITKQAQAGLPMANHGTVPPVAANVSTPQMCRLRIAE